MVCMPSNQQNNIEKPKMINGVEIKACTRDLNVQNISRSLNVHLFVDFLES
jgi:hypothetical protein